MEAVKLWESKYLIFGKEIGETGTQHLQGYVCFENQRTLTALKKLSTRAHWEIARGTPKQASEYCEKDGDVFEKGTRPMSQSEKGSGEKRRWEDAFIAVSEGRYDDVPKDILCSKLKNIEYAVDRVRMSKQQLETLDGELEHEWWYGPTGTGKSKEARDRYPGSYIKDPKNAWWDGYKGEENVIIDDFDKFQVKQSGDLKRWLDRYVFKAEVKGGYIGDIRPKRIIITSNYHPKEIWEETDITLSTIMRRVKVTRFHPPLAAVPAGPPAAAVGSL